MTRQSYPSRIDNFSHLYVADYYRVTYYHPNIVAEVFPYGIENLSPKATLTEIATIVNQSKAAHLEKLIKQNEVRVA